MSMQAFWTVCGHSVQHIRMPRSVSHQGFVRNGVLTPGANDAPALLPDIGETAFVAVQPGRVESRPHTSVAFALATVCCPPLAGLAPAPSTVARPGCAASRMQTRLSSAALDPGKLTDATGINAASVARIRHCVLPIWLLPRASDHFTMLTVELPLLSGHCIAHNVASGPLSNWRNQSCRSGNDGTLSQPPGGVICVQRTAPDRRRTRSRRRRPGARPSRRS